MILYFAAILLTIVYGVVMWLIVRASEAVRKRKSFISRLKGFFVLGVYGWLMYILVTPLLVIILAEMANIWVAMVVISIVPMGVGIYYTYRYWRTCDKLSDDTAESDETQQN